MKKITKFLLLAAAALIALGLIVSMIGLVCGANPASILSHGLWNMTVYQAPSDSNVSSDGTYRVDPAGIDELSINWLNGTVTVEAYDGTDILISETADVPLTAENSLHYKVTSGELTVSSCRPSVELSFGPAAALTDKELLIQLPAELAHALKQLDFDAQNASLRLSDLQLRELEISTLNGDASAQQLTADSMDFDTQNGSLLLDNATLRDLSVSGLDGDVTATASSIRSLSLDVMNGDLTGDFIQCPESVEVQSLNGSARLTIPADSQFTAHWDSLSPNAYRSSFQGTYDRSTHTVGSGRCAISLKTMSGSLEIQAAD